LHIRSSPLTLSDYTSGLNEALLFPSQGAEIQPDANMAFLDNLRALGLGMQAGRASRESDSCIGNPTSTTIAGRRVKNGNFILGG
jgi:hypothetical protein